MTIMHRTERVFILAALLFVGLGLMVAIGRGVIGQGGQQYAMLLWIMAASLILVGAAGALWLKSGVQTTPATTLPDSYVPLLRIPLDVIIPATMVAGFVIFLQLFESGTLQALILVIAGLSLAGVFWAQAHARDWSDARFGLAQSLLNVISHLTAFLLFSAIYGLKARALFTSAPIGLVTALLVYEMLSRDATWHKAMQLPVEGRRSTIVLLSLAAGVVTAEIAWALNYWAAVPTLIGGAFLLVIFYVTYGVISNYVDRSITRRILLEFGVVGAVSLAVVFASAFLS